MPTSTITATYAQNSFGEVIRRVSKDGEHLIIEKDGIPVAVVMSVQEYKLLSQERLAYFQDFSRQLGRVAEAQGITEEQLMKELDEDKRAVYEEMYGAYVQT